MFLDSLPILLEDVLIGARYKIYICMHQSLCIMIVYIAYHASTHTHTYGYKMILIELNIPQYKLRYTQGTRLCMNLKHQKGRVSAAWHTRTATAYT